MSKYRCKICGYVYDESVGDSTNGIKPGTEWGNLRSDFACPMCGASKDEFEKQ
jgi:rubredoxin